MSSDELKVVKDLIGQEAQSVKKPVRNKSDDVKPSKRRRDSVKSKKTSKQTDWNDVEDMLDELKSQPSSKDTSDVRNEKVERRIKKKSGNITIEEVPGNEQDIEEVKPSKTRQQRQSRPRPPREFDPRYILTSITTGYLLTKYISKYKDDFIKWFNSVNAATKTQTLDRLQNIIPTTSKGTVSEAKQLMSELSDKINAPVLNSLQYHNEAPQPKEEIEPVEENPGLSSAAQGALTKSKDTKQAAENKIVDQSLGNEQALVRAQSSAMNANNNAAQQTGAPDPLANQMATTNEQQQELNTQLSKLNEEDFTQDELINKPQTPINSFINNLENSAQTPFTQTLLEVLKKNRDDGKVSASIDDNNQMKFHYKGRTYNPETFLLIMNNKVVRKMRNKERGVNEKEDRNKKRGVIERQYLKNYDAYKLTQMRENEIAKRKASFNGYRVNPVILQSNL